MKKVLSIISLLLVFTYMVQAKRDTTSTPPTRITIAITSESGSITLNGTTPTNTAIVNGVKVYYETYDVDGDAVALKAIPNAGFGFQQWESNDPVDAYFPFKIVPSISFNLTVFSTDGYINVNTKPMTYIDTLFLLAKYYDNTICNTLFPISEHGYFNPVADALGLGSYIAVDSSKTDAGIPAIVYTQALGDGSKWPWINLNFELSPTDSAKNPLDSINGKKISLATLNEDVKAIQITYKIKTDGPNGGGEWKMVLPFNEYLTSGDNGNSFNGGGDHMVVLPIKENVDFYTYTAYLFDFKVPAWYDGNTDSVNLNPLIGNLNKVRKIGFKLNSDARTGEFNGELYIQSIKLCGFGGKIPVDTIIADPITVTGQNTTVACGNSTQLSININGANPTDCYYNWSPSIGLDWTGSSSPYASPATTTTYVVTVTSNLGATASTSVVVNVTPNTNMINLGNDKPLCKGSSVTLEAWGNISDYHWSNGSNSEYIIVNTVGTYTVTVTNYLGCTDSDAILIYASSGPTNVSIIGKQEVEVGDLSMYSAKATNASGYQWEIDNGQILGDNDSITIVGFPNSPALSNLKVKAYQGSLQCSTIVSLPINVKANVGRVVDTVYVSAQTLTYLASVIIISNDTASKIITDPNTIKEGQNLSSFTTKAFPNPVTSNLQVDLTSVFAGKITVKLWSSDGNLIYSKNDVGSVLHQIPMSSYSNGIYILEIIRNGKVIAQKAISKM